MDIYIKDFTSAPGGRYKKEGNFSGEKFREDYLEPLFSNGQNEPINIFLDGTEGYPSSFLEEAFGGLARKIGDKELVKSKIKLISEDPILVREILTYIDNA